MITEQQKLAQLLEDEGITIGGITLGDNPGSVEEIARQVREAILSSLNGEAREMPLESFCDLPMDFDKI